MGGGVKRHRPINKTKIEPRTCLRCGDEFPSEGPSNRICQSCSHSNAKFRLVGVVSLGVRRAGKVPGSF